MAALCKIDFWSCGEKTRKLTNRGESPKQEKRLSEREWAL